MADTTQKEALTTKMGHRRVRRGNTTDAEALKLILIEAAHELFKEGGLAALTMRNLAAKAQVAAMTPYTYFKNKSDILSHIKDDIIREMLDLSLKSVKEATSAREALHRSNLCVLQFLAARPDKFRLMFYSSEDDTDETLTWGGAASLTTLDLYEFDQSLLVALAREVGGHPENACLASSYRYATIIGFTQLCLLRMREISRSAEAMNAISEVMLDAVVHMLKKEPDPSKLAALFPSEANAPQPDVEKPNTNVGPEG